MNFYKTLEYITEPEYRYYFLQDAGHDIFKIQDKIKYRDQEKNIIKYAEKCKSKQQYEGACIFSDGATAILTTGPEYEKIEGIEKNGFLAVQIKQFMEKKEIIKDSIEPAFIIANAKYNGYTGAKNENNYYCIIADQVFDIRQIEKIYKLLYVSKTQYNNGITFYKSTTGPGIALISKYGIGVILPLNLKADTMKNRPFDMSYAHFKDTINTAEKIFAYGEKPAEKTA